MAVVRMSTTCVKYVQREHGTVEKTYPYIRLDRSICGKEFRLDFRVTVTHKTQVPE